MWQPQPCRNIPMATNYIGKLVRTFVWMAILLSFNEIYSWWRHQMGTFSALLAICAGNSPVPDEFPAQRPVTRSFAVFFDLRPNKRLSKQSWGWWFETLSCSLWRHRNVVMWILWNMMVDNSFRKQTFIPIFHDIKLLWYDYSKISILIDDWLYLSFS